MSDLDIDHGCFNGPEAQFDGLRCMWAVAAGYGLHDFRNQGGPVMPRIEYERYSDQDMLGEWPDGAPDDPLIILLVHNEYYGRIKWQHAPYLADRLEEIEHRLTAPGTVSAWVLLTQQFIRGLRTAAHWRQDVTFS
jgi:hypothetical protein